MKQDNWHRFFSIRSIFLYFVMVLLPLLVSYFAIRYMIKEDYLARKEVLSQQLDKQANKLPLISSDEYQFQDFFNGFFTQRNLLKHSPDDIANLLNKIEKLYPKGFKWIFWDKKAKMIPIKSQTILEGKRSWETLFSSLMEKFNILGNLSTFSDTSKYRKKINYSLDVLQRALGKNTKVEHLQSASEKVMNASWFGNDCMIIWGVDAISYQFENVPKEIRGGCLLMAFKDALGEDFWLNRLLKRRTRLKSILPFPIVTFDLTEKKILHLDSELKNPEIPALLINAYIKRNSSIFEFSNFMARAAANDEDSSLRIISIVDLTKLNYLRDERLQMLNFSALLSLLFVTILSIHFLIRNNSGLSLRKRIALLFLVAVFMPVISLISVGHIFLSHEEKRLFETAYLEMEEGLAALELRYKDAPRLIEKTLFKDITNLIGQKPFTIEKIKSGMEKAVKDDMLQNYIVADAKGNFILDNWEDINPAIKNGLKMSARKMLANDGDMNSARKSVLTDAIDEEMEEVLSTINAALDLSRPTHLRYYCFQDFHMYFMSCTIWLNEQPHALLVHVPDHLIERKFVIHEFAKNIQAVGTSEKKDFELRSELFFYSRFKANQHLPEYTELWTSLAKEFDRAFKLKVKETGKIVLDGEQFLYTIMPLRTMYKQSYIPCMLTTTKQIDALLRDRKIMIFALASFASLGAFLLSLILAASLLGPIKSIDSAAQLVGKGDLSVSLPEIGDDEIGRLSKSFNEMVKGLRERERMQAYVSDSVLEAVQDHADPTLGAGKTIEATILFSDIRNFTGLTEQYRPDKIFSLLNEFLGGVEPLIRENKGRVDKFIGDAVMAVFHENHGEHHALSALKAAVAMKKFVKNLNYQREKQGLFTINIGIGISTGTVLLGDVGSSRRKDLTVIGDEVNLAARLEAASKQGRHSRIIISGSTFNHVADSVEVEEMPFTEVRGKKHAVKIFELVKLLIKA